MPHVFIPGAIDLSHPAFAEQRLDAVARPEVRTGSEFEPAPCGGMKADSAGRQFKFAGIFAGICDRAAGTLL